MSGRSNTHQETPDPDASTSDLPYVQKANRAVIDDPHATPAQRAEAERTAETLRGLAAGERP